MSENSYSNNHLNFHKKKYAIFINSYLYSLRWWWYVTRLRYYSYIWKSLAIQHWQSNDHDDKSKNIVETCINTFPRHMFKFCSLCRGDGGRHTEGCSHYNADLWLDSAILVTKANWKGRKIFCNLSFFVSVCWTNRFICMPLNPK